MNGIGLDHGPPSTGHLARGDTRRSPASGPAPLPRNARADEYMRRVDTSRHRTEPPGHPASVALADPLPPEPGSTWLWENDQAPRPLELLIAPGSSLKCRREMFFLASAIDSPRNEGGSTMPLQVV